MVIWAMGTVFPWYTTASYKPPGFPEDAKWKQAFPLSNLHSMIIISVIVLCQAEEGEKKGWCLVSIINENAALGPLGKALTLQCDVGERVLHGGQVPQLLSRTDSLDAT